MGPCTKRRFEQNEKFWAIFYRHESETAKDEEKFLTVNLHKMITSLNNVFTVPRNYRSASLRDATSDYITQKFGNLGLLVGLQYFYPSRFYNQVSKQRLHYKILKCPGGFLSPVLHCDEFISWNLIFTKDPKGYV